MNVCTRCFDDVGLGTRIKEIRKSQPDEQKCDFHPTMKGVPISEVAQIVDDVFRQRWVLGRYDPRTDDFFGESVESALEGLTGANQDEVVNALIDALEQTEAYWPDDMGDRFYDRSLSYEPNQGSLNRHSAMWRSFCRSLVHGQRFFNAAAKTKIEFIFANIHRQQDADGRPVVYVIAPGEKGSRFSRARIADEYDLRARIHRDPARELGAPPARLRRPGRLNASGISAFYAAYERDTCHAELRPTAGSIVASAEFELLKPLCVLDTTRFGAPAHPENPFARNSLNRAAQWLFMKNFREEIANPIRLSDEHLDYVPTQAVAEYLNHHLKFDLDGKSRRIDAIIYQSAQNGVGRNIAVLGPASVVEQSSNTAADWEDLEDDFNHLEEPRSLLEPWLRLVPQSVENHRIDGVQVTPHLLAESYTSADRTAHRRPN